MGFTKDGVVKMSIAGMVIQAHENEEPPEIRMNTAAEHQDQRRLNKVVDQPELELMKRLETCTAERSWKQ